MEGGGEAKILDPFFHFSRIMHIFVQIPSNWRILIAWLGGRDSSVGKSSASQAGDPGSNPGLGLTSGHPIHEREGKRLPAVKVILHQLAWLTGAYEWFKKNKKKIAWLLPNYWTHICTYIFEYFIVNIFINIIIMLGGFWLRSFYFNLPI